jgi:competence protein ComK
LKTYSTYFIYRDTFALLPYFNEYGELFTTVIEKYKKVQVAKSPKQILMENCDFHGATLKGRIDSAKKVLPRHRLLPVYISDHFKLCFFPTKSMENVDCQWFSQCGIRTMVQHEKGTIVVLKNNERILVRKRYPILFDKWKTATYLVGTYQDREQQIAELIAEDRGIYRDDEREWEDD